LRRVVDEEAAAISEAFPQLKRNVSGYNLDRLVAEAYGDPEAFDENTDETVAIDGEPDPNATVNLARVFAGSEGTLGVVTEATVSLEPVPETTGVVLLTYEDLLEAMADVDTIVRHFDPRRSRRSTTCCSSSPGIPRSSPTSRRTFPKGTETALLVEFYAESEDDAREKVAAMLADRLPDSSAPESDRGATAATESTPDSDPVRAFDALEAYAPDDRAELWKLRKSAAPILLSPNLGRQAHLLHRGYGRPDREPRGLRG